MKRISLALFLLALLLGSKATCLAAGKVVIVSLDRTSLSRAAADPELGPWLERGAVGLMNTGTAARPTAEHIYTTLGAGSRALGTEYTRLVFNRDEEFAGYPAALLYRRHQGREPDGKVIMLVPAAAGRINGALRYPVLPGLLGGTLHSFGRLTAVLGNSDGQGYYREAAAMLADQAGQVALGNVSKSVLQKDALFPYGVRLDPEAMLPEFAALLPQADVILVNWGDTARLDEYRPFLSAATEDALRGEILAAAACFLESALTLMDREDVLLLLSPVPPAGESGGGLLGWAVLIGPDVPPGSFLTSGTTRRTGVVALTDVAPTVLDRLGLPWPGAMIGRPFAATGAGGVEHLLVIQTKVDRLFRLRPPLLKTYVFFQIVIVLGAVLNLFARFARPVYFEAPLYGLLLFPVLVLYLPLHAVSLAGAFVITAAALVVAVALLLLVSGDATARFAVAGIVTALSLVVDLLRDAPLIKVSVLGYDVVSGARYYGLGNEYMGVLVGSALLGTASLLQLYPRHRCRLLSLAAFFLAALVLLLVAPQGGANFGGTVTAAVAFLVALSVSAQLRPGWQSGTAVTAIILVLTAIGLFLNTRVPAGAQSHLGRMLSMLGSEGWQALVDVVSRKAAMNARLFRYSQWSKAFLVFLATLAVLFYRPRGVLARVRAGFPMLSAGFLGIIAGSITAFLFNDSGVVAAATTLLYAAVPVILLCGQAAEAKNN